MTVRDERERVAQRPSRATWWLFTLAAIVPPVWMVGFLSLVVRARLSTGHWPQLWEDPTPTGALSYSLWVVLAGLLPVVYFVGAVYVLGLAVCVCVRSLRTALHEAAFTTWHLAVPAGTQAALAFLIHFDPWYLFTWWID